MADQEAIEALARYERKKAKALEAKTNRIYISKPQISSRLTLSLNAIFYDPKPPCISHKVAIEAVYKHPTRKELIWCPIASVWKIGYQVKATRVFDWEYGQEFMETIFGVEAKNEFYCVENSLLMCQEAAERFQRGYFTLIPDIRRYIANVNDWDKASPKRYRIKVISPQGFGMLDKVHPGNNRRWNELGGAIVTFKSNRRPRACYLYFHYCLSVLRFSWMFPKDDWTKTKNDLRRNCWVTKRYMQPRVFRAFANEFEDNSDNVLAEQSKKKDESLFHDGSAELLLGLIVSGVVEKSWPKRDEGARNFSQIAFSFEEGMDW